MLATTAFAGGWVASAGHGPTLFGLALLGLAAAGVAWRPSAPPPDDALARAEAAREEGARHLKSITDHLPALITYVDTRQVVTFANATFRSWLGVDPDAMIGKPLVDLIGEEMYAQRLGYLARGFAGERLSFEMPVRTPTGERDLETTYVPDFRPDGAVAGIFVLVTDVSTMRATERQLRRLARVDPLTGLPNRLAFDEALGDLRVRTRRDGVPMAVIFLDIDHFKSVNDTHGHAAGDAVLVAFSTRMRGALRKADLVARLSGDEFVILLEGLDVRDHAVLLAERIQDRVRPALMFEGTALLTTASIGIAIVDADDDATPADVLARADAALYEAKRSGRDRYRVG